jgi:hypothetical protein
VSFREEEVLNFYRHNWYYVGAILFAAISFFMGFWGDVFSPLQKILVYNFLALLAHQFEEYAYPGGFPAIFNIAVFHEKEVPERYPLNANQVLITNVFLAYPIYIAPIIWPKVIWLGIAVMLFGMLQLVVHGIIINLRLKSLYNPGLATTVLLFWPIGIYYIWFVVTNNLASAGDFVIGGVGAVVAAAVTIQLPIKLLADKQSRYPFSEAEMGGFAKLKLQAMRRS